MFDSMDIHISDSMEFHISDLCAFDLLLPDAVPRDWFGLLAVFPSAYVFVFNWVCYNGSK